MRLGFLGGSFDPFHMGHMEMARIALEEANLDKVYFLPSAYNWHKKQLPSPINKRCEWIEKSIEGLDKIGLLQVDSHGENRYTVDTVSALKERFPDAEIYWIIGADLFSMIHTWRLSNELAKMVRAINST